ncbi:MAG: hypothetical protein GX892_05890 [Thermoanaerobacteraceae bacterium]|nr:hypothetical protein [Thermoanaerobacteraceae bacterium]
MFYRWQWLIFRSIVQIYLPQNLGLCSGIIYGKYNEEIIQTALKCADLAIEHISNPYTDIKIDIEELKEDLLEMKAELE